MGEYLVKCVKDGSVMHPYSLTCTRDSSLLRTEYKSRLLVLENLPGIWKFINWLPVNRHNPKLGNGPVTYKSQNLAKELDLENLYISFSGYWPERHCKMTTCSFKELEAAPTMQRLSEAESNSTLVVASAGNTARAFADAAEKTGQKLLLIVPKKAIHRLWTAGPHTNGSQIKIISVEGDYTDAIGIAEKIQSARGFVPEGGARNIARRDGMGTVMLDAAINIGRIPDHYFQAVGSGTGGISAWEAALRLIQDGRFGKTPSKLHLAQNIPNAPIYYAWKNQVPGAYEPEMFDDVLFNRRPPYDIPGGVKDALIATGGQVYGVEDKAANEAKILFEKFEEIDILNAAAVAVAALLKAVELRTVESKDTILLNITGGGLKRVKIDHSINSLGPDTTISCLEEAISFLGMG